MDKIKPMPVLLIEDDVAECVNYKDCANRRTDVSFVGMTSSSEEGLRYLKSRLPEAVILDLELHKGKGSGLQFLADLKAANIALRPLIVVTTNSPSHVVYNHVRDMGADLVFYKQQSDYSPDMVISTLLALRKSLHATLRDRLPDDIQSIESPEDRRARIAERIDAELELVGINVKYKGRIYLHEAIYLLITKEKNNPEAVVSQVAEIHKTSYSAVARAIKTAIVRAWDMSNIEDLQQHYTARIDVRTGIPTMTEFIHYYADKISKTM